MKSDRLKRLTSQSVTPVPEKLMFRQKAQVCFFYNGYTVDGSNPCSDIRSLGELVER